MGDDERDLSEQISDETADVSLNLAKSAEYAGKKEIQKKIIKKAYQKRVRKEAEKYGRSGINVSEKAGMVIARGGRIVWESIRKNKGFLITILVVFLTFAVILTELASCMGMGNVSLTAFALSTYPSRDDDMLGAENMYSLMEEELKKLIEDYPKTHDYDEYIYNLDEFYHDPYVLISLVTAKMEGEWALNEAEGFLMELFERQYNLTETITKEVRYKTQKRIGTVRTKNKDGTYTTRTYTYYVDVPYDWYICTITLTNNNLSFLPIETLSENELEMYAVYMATLGNREDLFPDSEYQGRYNNSENGYEVTGEALNDPKFAAMMEEALKYLGYPFVFGGSSPSTSFDCSGYVSWVLNHSGWDVGRLGATQLYNITDRVTSAELKPGDLVFFKGTYETRTPNAVSHCGIYVGNGMMLHAGDPIGFTDLRDDYWQEHFFAYGRMS